MVIYNVMKNRPATPTEIDWLVRNNCLYLNWSNTLSNGVVTIDWTGNLEIWGYRVDLN